MDGMRNKIEINTDTKKIEWEVPKLISLDKGKTEGGAAINYTEDYSLSPGS